MRHQASAVSHLAQKMLPEKDTAITSSQGIYLAAGHCPTKQELSGVLSGFIPCLVAAGALQCPHQGTLHIEHGSRHTFSHTVRLTLPSCLCTRLQASGTQKRLSACVCGLPQASDEQHSGRRWRCAPPLKSQCTTQWVCRKAIPSAMSRAVCRIVSMQGGAMGVGAALNMPLLMAICATCLNSSELGGIFRDHALQNSAVSHHLHCTWGHGKWHGEVLIQALSRRAGYPSCEVHLTLSMLMSAIAMLIRTYTA